MIKKLPLPISGVMLGFAALGNLLQSYSEAIRLICGIVSLILGLLLIFKAILYPFIFKEDMQNPIMAGVSATFPMAIMLLSTYVKPLIGQPAIFIWYFGILLHIILIAYFTIKFIFNFDIKKVFTPYFIVYVGLAVSSVSAPIFEKTTIGTLSFWFAFIMCMLLLIIVTYRYSKYKEIPPPAKPLFCIYAAPVSLCLAGYIQSVQRKSLLMIGFLAILSFIIYIMVLLKLPKYLKMQFFPSYSAFTFPFVISGIALKMTMAYLTKLGYTIVILKYIVLLQTIIAILLVIYTLYRFILFLLPERQNNSISQ
ncbi:TDT family transporter [Clostridium sp. Sa3CUN1]|uniref:TDT family transporter n=1 Tax=Clostridium gallinarum TaxID=2762246 RepID=A0ABR8Q6G8_9CLOT|nr:TDT family transporter [Clostridium gallinarum]MBD7915975.1 TDT family transporter [Clostridium gallinarum]